MSETELRHYLANGASTRPEARDGRVSADSVPISTRGER